MSVGAIDKNGTFFDTAPNVPVDVSVKTRRNQAAVNTALMRPERGRGKLVFVNLQKRLLSGIEASAQPPRAMGHAREAFEGYALKARRPSCKPILRS